MFDLLQCEPHLAVFIPTVQPFVLHDLRHNTTSTHIPGGDVLVPLAVKVMPVLVARAGRDWHCPDSAEKWVKTNTAEVRSRSGKEWSKNRRTVGIGTCSDQHIVNLIKRANISSNLKDLMTLAGESSAKTRVMSPQDNAISPK